jgi:hypothetical protein
VAEIGGLLAAAERGRIPLDAMARRIAELTAPPVGVLQATAFRAAETPEERLARRTAATTRLLDADPGSGALFAGTCGRTKLEWYCSTNWPGGFLGRARGVAPPSGDWIRTGAIPEYKTTETNAAGAEYVLTHTEQGIKHPCCVPRDKSCDVGALGKWTQRAAAAAAAAPPRPATILAAGVLAPLPLRPTPPPAPPAAPHPGDSPQNPIFITGLFQRTYLGVDGLWYSVRGTL